MLPAPVGVRDPVALVRLAVGGAALVLGGDGERRRHVRLVVLAPAVGECPRSGERVSDQQIRRHRRHDDQRTEPEPRLAARELSSSGTFDVPDLLCRHRCRRVRHRCEDGAHLGRVRAVRGVLGEEGGDEVGERARGRSRRRGRRVENRLEGGGGVAAAERGDALRRRVQDHAEGPEVGRGAGPLAQHPLRGDVFGRSDEAAGVRQVGLALDLRDAEVGEDDPVVAAQQDVVRLHVTVQDARRVGRFEGAEHLEADAGRVPRVEGALLQRVAQRAAGHQLHHDPRLTVDDGHIVHVHDGRVIEPGRRAGLAAHPLEGLLPFAFGKVVRDARFLHGDLAVHRLVLGAPHRAHTAVPELAEQPVPAGYEASGAGVGRLGPRRTRRRIGVVRVRHDRGRGGRRRCARRPGRRPVPARVRWLQSKARRLVGSVSGSPLLLMRPSISRRTPPYPPLMLSGHRPVTERATYRPLRACGLTRGRRCPARRRSTPSPPAPSRPARTPTRRTSGRSPPSTCRRCAGVPPPC